MDISRYQKLTHVETMPDGRNITTDDLQPGWWVQYYVGAWPHDTESGYAIDIHGGGVTLATRRSQYPVFVSWRRVASILRVIEH